MSPRLAHAAYVLEQNTEGIGKVVILNEEGRLAPAREKGLMREVGLNLHGGSVDLKKRLSSRSSVKDYFSHFWMR